MRIVILMYHMVSEHEKKHTLSISTARFKRHMWYLKSKKYTPISLDQLQRYFFNKADSLPERPVIITFDDGYMDNYENALPILREYNFSATIFIVSGLVGKVNQWIKAEGYPERPLMGWREIEDMKRNGITIGSHTLNHPRLSLLENKDVRREIEGSKKLFEDRLGVPINHFAYPYGDMNESIIDIVREAGYTTACSVMSGFNSERINLFKLRRIGVFGSDSLRRFAVKLTFGTNDGNLSLPAKYYMGRLGDKVTRWTLV